MKILRFYKVSPGGNSTILVMDPVSRMQRAKIARALMSEHHLQGEQVGFLDLASNPVRLDMMGGEFCGNACRATAAVMAWEKVGLKKTAGTWHGKISVSGVEQLLNLKVVLDQERPDYWVEMPLGSAGLAGCIQELEPGIGLVSLPGIVHLCLDEQKHPFPANYKAQAQNLRQRYGLSGPAVGCIWYRTDPHYQIKPVVWVQETSSTYFETGCGSGCLAIALWQSCGKNLPLDLKIMQPSGSNIGVLLRLWEEKIQAWIYGPVSLIAKGEAYLPNASSE